MPLEIPEGNWAQYEVDNTAVKIWIPEVLESCLEVLAEHFEQTKSDLARNALMVHIHGRFTFEQLVAQKLWRTRRRTQIEDTRMFSMGGLSIKLRDTPRVAYIKHFGKNTQDLKVWMPRALELDVDSQAIELRLTRSEYIRRVLTAYFLGRRHFDPLGYTPQEDEDEA